MSSELASTLPASAAHRLGPGGTSENPAALAKLPASMDQPPLIPGRLVPRTQSRQATC